MKIAYFDCFSGISGDMILGALVDLGLEPDLLEGELARLKLEGYQLNFAKSEKHGIVGTKAHVELSHHDHHHGRHLSDIRRLIGDSDLSEDCFVNMADMAMLAEGWQNSYDITDLADMTMNWLQ